MKVIAWFLVRFEDSLVRFAEWVVDKLDPLFDYMDDAEESLRKQREQ